MLRATFFAAGLFVGLWGISLLFIDKLVLNTDEVQARDEGVRGLFTTANTGADGAQQAVFDPPDWAAFSLMSIGSVTMLYSVALPKKKPS